MGRRGTSLENRATKIVRFHLGDSTYLIDILEKKVYRRFVEIETAKAAEIISSWRASVASV